MLLHQNVYLTNYCHPNLIDLGFPIHYCSDPIRHFSPSRLYLSINYYHDFGDCKWVTVSNFFFDNQKLFVLFGNLCLGINNPFQRVFGLRNPIILW